MSTRVNHGVMSPSVNNDGRCGATGFVVVGNPGSRRVALFQAALARLELPPAQVVSYAGLLAGHLTLPDVVRRGAIVRIESPGQDWEVERVMLAAGADVSAEEGCEHIPREEIGRLAFERGRILPSRQWYLGFCETLRLIERQLAACPPHRLMNQPAEIAVMFDKSRCHARLLRAGVAVPPSIGPAACFDELIERMRQAACYRVFVKPAHGSSASGVVAYQSNGQRHHATTTVEMVREGGTLRLYNSRRMRIYQEPRQIAELIDALCRQRVHVERWLPKAGFDNRTFDLRVVVVAARARHVVVRLSRSPMTNLHLLNTRGDVEALLARMGPAAWEAARSTCERVMECFAGSLYAGIDLLICPGYRRHAVLEANAFGDLLPGVLHDGLDTYAAEVLAMLPGATPRG